MKTVSISEKFATYCHALEWLESIFGELLTADSRIYEYREILANEVRRFAASPTGLGDYPENPVEVVEAHLEASTVSDIYLRYRGRNDKVFLEKLFESLMGPKYSSQEVGTGYDKGKNSFGRNIQTELLIASKAKDPTKVDFSGNDIVFDLGSLKVGIECKRIFSAKKIFQRFDEACTQIEKNDEVKYGLVAFRFDKYMFLMPGMGKPELAGTLVKRDGAVLLFQRPDDLPRYMDYQCARFYNLFNLKLGLRAKRKGFKKVLGFCALTYLPTAVGYPITPVVSGNMVWALWYKDDPDRNMAFRAVIQELDFS